MFKVELNAKDSIMFFSFRDVLKSFLLCDHTYNGEFLTQDFSNTATKYDSNFPLKNFHNIKCGMIWCSDLGYSLSKLILIRIL
jgi:hypothetical protein